MSNTWMVVADACRAGFIEASHGLGDANGAKDEIATRFASRVCAHLKNNLHRNTLGKPDMMGTSAFLSMPGKHQSEDQRNLISDQSLTGVTTQTPERIRTQLRERL